MNKFPVRKDIASLFLICVFPIHTWAIFIFFHSLPGYLLRLSTVDILGVLGYILSFALLESLIVTGILVITSLLVPRKWLFNYFFVMGSILVLVTSIWLIPAHFWLWTLTKTALRFNDSLGMIFIWGITYLITLSFLFFRIRRTTKIEIFVRSLADKLSILSSFYVLVDFFCIGIIIIRNLR